MVGQGVVEMERSCVVRVVDLYCIVGAEWGSRKG